MPPATANAPVPTRDTVPPVRRISLCDLSYRSVMWPVLPWQTEGQENVGVGSAPPFALPEFRKLGAVNIRAHQYSTLDHRRTSRTLWEPRYVL
jgi:hypothetical protein